MSERIDALRKLLERNPANSAVRFGLAVEYLKAERYEEAVDELNRYLAEADDEGNAYGRLGHALRMLNRDAEARDAYRQGIEAALRHGHPTMAEEFRTTLDEWDAGSGER